MYHSNAQKRTYNRAKMTKADRNRRKTYLPGGMKGLEDLLTKANGGVVLIKERAIAMIINGERGDRHGVLELFKEVTDKEKKRREEQAKELAKELDS